MLDHAGRLHALPGIADCRRRQAAGHNRNGEEKQSVPDRKISDRHVVGFPPGHDVALRHAHFACRRGVRQPAGIAGHLLPGPSCAQCGAGDIALESTAFYAAGSDASSLFDKTHPRIASNVKILQHSPFCRYFSNPSRAGGFPGQDRRASPPPSAKRMTFPFPRKAY
ncbi:hypothetical protein QCN28_13525 [Bordetella bronchiseptica]|uniref:hypothetical protein n=1 Tax=Bordetella bronchiseptica TaxID=518 RepID=UPI003F745256